MEKRWTCPWSHHPRWWSKAPSGGCQRHQNRHPQQQPVYFKAKSKYTPELLKYKLPLYLVFLAVSFLFLVVNLACALLVKMTATEVKTIVLVRVTINDTLFVLCAISLSVCLYKVAKMSLASIYLESKGTSVCQVTLIGVLVVLLYASRACYNLVVLALTDIETINSFDYDWYNVSDQADLRSTLGDAGYIVFGVILFVWELLPTSLVVFFFRVRRLPQDRSGSGIPNHVLSSRGYFFDNPRRYDSDDDLAWSIPPQNNSARWRHTSLPAWHILDVILDVSPPSQARQDRAAHPPGEGLTAPRLLNHGRQWHPNGGTSFPRMLGEQNPCPSSI
ncbi:G protein-coupled receptor 137Ba-like isoform X4 [Oncorhynchus nerka]|uniref:G protein-coupled receptor 137Ba-like isoform X4 n=1 Tax=Oncorhynchus nerka TaxID=8023 RepID=UPI001131DA3B|nr:integral membrane protein GPR137B-like isoform X2 [Oncorhynchus nerka]